MQPQWLFSTTKFITNTAWKVSVFGVFLVRIFLYSDWIPRDTEYLSVVSSNAGKYGPEKLLKRTLFTQWNLLSIAKTQMFDSDLVGVQQDFQMFYRILNTSLYGVHRIKEAATLKFRKIDRKAPVSESLFQQSCRREACNSIKKGDCDTDVFLWISKKFKTVFFMEHLRVIFSGISRKIYLTLAM